MRAILDRPALLYPYIYFCDDNWLKATLLCFGQVRRIVPNGFTLDDSPLVRRLCELKGNGGEPLVANEPAYLRSALEAQERLAGRLNSLPRHELKCFTRAATAREFEGDVTRFEIHRGKMDTLLDFLTRERLAWPSRGMSSTEGEWFALHPRLGEAVMSVIAIAIAREKGLDVVTSSGSVHRAVAMLDEDAVLAQISGLANPGPTVTTLAEANTADDLVQTVMLTALDPSKLTPEQVAELIKDGKDLRAFRAEVATFAQAIPDILDCDERKKRLAMKANEVIEKWEQHKKALPKFALDAMISAGNYTSPVAIAGLLGASSVSVVAAGVGLAIGLATYAGFGIWHGYKEKTSSPYQYLSRIQSAGAVLAAPQRARIAG